MVQAQNGTYAILRPGESEFIGFINPSSCVCFIKRDIRTELEFVGSNLNLIFNGELVMSVNHFIRKKNTEIYIVLRSILT